MASSARIDELRKKFDENPRRYFAPLANEYRKAGDLEQAIFICQEYLPQQPGHMSGHIVYGQALFELSRYDESRQVFETALSLDPENLIALRHLGDIARQTGDSRSARTWYQRVLEADPRNEEIAEIMMSLLATPVASQMAIDPNMMPLGTPAMSEPAVNGDVRRPTDPSGLPTAGLGFQVEKSEDRSDLEVGPELAALPERQPAEPAIPEATLRAQIPEDELLDLNDFDFTVGGIPLSELGATPSIDPVPAASAEEEKPADEPAAEEEQEAVEEESFTESSSAFVAYSDRSYDAPNAVEEPAVDTAGDSFAAADDDDAAIEKDEPPFEADPYAIAATASLPDEERGPDINLGLPDDDTTRTLSDSPVESVLGLETFESGMGLSAAEPETSVEFDSFFAPPTEASEAASDIGRDETRVDESPSEESLAEEYDAIRAEAAAEEPVASSDGFSPFETPASSFETQPEPLVESVFELSLPTELPPVEAVVEEESTVEALVLEEPVQALPELVPDEPVEEEPAPAFVTETMAELYLQQGHVEAALEIYQQLVQQRPFDVALRDRLRVLDDRLHGPTPVYTPAVTEEPPAPEAPAGPTIREFLAEIVSWRPSVYSAPTPISTSSIDESFGEDGGAYAAEPAIEAMMGDDATIEEAASIEALTHMDLEVMGIEQPPSIDEEFGADPASDAYDAHRDTPIDPYDIPIPSLLHTSFELPVQTPISDPAEVPPPAQPSAGRPTPTHRGTPSIPGETVSGSIDALFSGAGSSSGDADAASTLAQAFAPDGPDATPLQGMPAHKASSELSLDHVFKTGHPPRPSGESEAFSFDQFFADEMVEGGSKPGGDTPSEPGNAGDDIAQFNNWLNGLKKT